LRYSVRCNGGNPERSPFTCPSGTVCVASAGVNGTAGTVQQADAVQAGPAAGIIDTLTPCVVASCPNIGINGFGPRGV
jgi:hypothetical protein